jgi:hypothetical protein
MKGSNMPTKDQLNAKYASTPAQRELDRDKAGYYADSDSLTVLTGKTAIKLLKINVSENAVNYGDFATHIEMHIDFATYVEAGRPDFIILYI